MHSIFIVNSSSCMKIIEDNLIILLITRLLREISIMVQYIIPSIYLANLIVKERYEKDKPWIKFLWLCTLLRPFLLWLILFYLPTWGAILGVIIYYLLWAYCGRLINSFAYKLYEFMDGDLRSTSDYYHFKENWKWLAFCLAWDIIAVVLGCMHFILAFGIVLAGEVVLLCMNLAEILGKYRSEFAPGNGRYTLKLSIVLNENYTEEQILNIVKSEYKNDYYYNYIPEKYY